MQQTLCVSDLKYLGTMFSTRMSVRDSYTDIILTLLCILLST